METLNFGVSDQPTLGDPLWAIGSAVEDDPLVLALGRIGRLEDRVQAQGHALVALEVRIRLLERPWWIRLRDWARDLRQAWRER